MHERYRHRRADKEAPRKIVQRRWACGAVAGAHAHDMRVLHCIDTLGGGGAERQLTYLSEGLVRLGVGVDVVYLVDGAFGSRLRASGAALHPLGWRTPLPLVADLCRIIRKERVDVVQTWLGRMSAAGGVAGGILGRPWIYSERSVREHDVGCRAALRRWLGARAAAVVANSEAGAAGWRQGALTRVHVVPNGVEVDAIAATPPAARATLDVADDAELVLYAGRFVAAKNLPLLGAALGALLAARPGAIALLCGDGEGLASVRAAVEAAGVGARCRALGFRSDLWPILRAADVVVAPSLHEGRPNVVLEAMAGRCPLVVSDIAGHRECVPREGARWFSAHDVAGAVAALGDCLDDRGAARARADIAFQAVRRHSVDQMARAYADLYDRVLRAAGGTRARV